MVCGGAQHLSGATGKVGPGDKQQMSVDRSGNGTGGDTEAVQREKTSQGCQQHNPANVEGQAVEYCVRRWRQPRGAVRAGQFSSEPDMQEEQARRNGDDV